MPQISILSLANNSVVAQMKNYRKRMIYSFSNLKCLDNQLIKQEERSLAIAFMKGGSKMEQQEKLKQQNDLLQWH